MSFQYISWTQQDAPHTALWRSERGATPPKRVQLADDTLSADAAYRLASEGVGLLWSGDFQNARHLVQALDRRLSKRSARKPRQTKAAFDAADLKPTCTAHQLTQAFHQQRQAQAQRAYILGSVLIPIQADGSIDLRRAPDVRQACNEAWVAQKEGETPTASVCSLRELLGIISAHEWRKKGVEVQQLGWHQDKTHHRIHPHYGVFSPVRGEYLELLAKTPLPLDATDSACNLTDFTAIDVGTGTGVLAFILAKRGIGQIIATDTAPRALACARDNVARLQAAGLKQVANVKIIEADLFPPSGQAQLIVCNPPWLPARPGSGLEQAVYDEDSRMLLGFLNSVGERLKDKGEAWLILSDLAERLGLRSREQLLEAIAQAGLHVIARIDTSPKHPKAKDATDPLFAARSREVTSLWRLRKA
jgi:methylase of polypeptide subunit release factors